MTSRQLLTLLAIIVAVVAVLRLLTGELISGLLTAILALALWSWASGYPLRKRAGQLWRLLRRWW